MAGRPEPSPTCRQAKGQESLPVGSSPSTSELSTARLCNYGLCEIASVLNLHFNGPWKLFVCSRKSYFLFIVSITYLLAFLRKKFFLV